MDQANEQQIAYNNSAYTTAGVIQLRLSTDGILDRLQEFLSGTKDIITQNEDGSTSLVKAAVGTPLCNAEGQQALCSIVSSLINPSTVQGNFTAEQYANILYRIDETLTEELLINSSAWEIDKRKRTTIKMFIIYLIEVFLTRPIDNKERDSYGQTLRHMESSRVEREKSMSLFNRGVNQP